MQFTVSITVSITSLSSGHTSFVASDSRCTSITQCVHTASGVDHLITAYSPSLLPAITRAAAMHTQTQSDHFMLFFFFHEIINNF
jgi:hypothetical protein